MVIYCCSHDIKCECLYFGNYLPCPFRGPGPGSNKKIIQKTVSHHTLLLSKEHCIITIILSKIKNKSKPDIDTRKCGRMLEKETSSTPFVSSFIVVNNAFVGLECLNSSTFDAVMIGGTLLNLSASEFLNLFRFFENSVPVIYLALNETTTDEEIESMGFSGVLRLPFTKKALVDVVSVIAALRLQESRSTNKNISTTFGPVIPTSLPPSILPEDSNLMRALPRAGASPAEVVDGAGADLSTANASMSTAYPSNVDDLCSFNVFDPDDVDNEDYNVDGGDESGHDELGLADFELAETRGGSASGRFRPRPGASPDLHMLVADRACV